jgi:hypothetical protein
MDSSLTQISTNENANTLAGHAEAKAPSVAALGRRCDGFRERSGCSCHTGGSEDDKSDFRGASSEALPESVGSHCLSVFA